MVVCSMVQETRRAPAHSMGVRAIASVEAHGRARRPPPRTDRPQRARVAPRAEAVDADGRRADPELVPLHPRLRALTRRPHQAHRRHRLRRVHRARPHRHGDDPGHLRQQLGVGVPGALRPLPQRRARRAHAPVGDQPRAVDRRRGPGAADRRRAAGLRAGGGRRPDPPPDRAGGGRRPGPRAVLVVRRDRGDLRALVGPHGVRDEHRDPPAELPGRRLLLGRHAPVAVARDQPRQPDLLPAQRGALRLPGDQRRQRRAVARGDRCAGRRGRGVELMAVSDQAPAQSPSAHSAGELRLVAAFGLVLGAMNLCIYESFARIPLGIAVTIEFAGPLGLAVVLSRRRLDLLWATLAALGIVLLADPGGGAIDAAGVILALVAAACWAAYILIAQAAGRVFTGGRGVALAMAVAVLVPLVPGIADAGSDLLEPQWLAIGCAVALASSVLPYSLETEALRRLPANVFGVLMSLEPGVAALAGFPVLGQDLRARDIVAIALVVTASIGVTRAGPTAPEA